MMKQYFSNNKTCAPYALILHCGPRSVVEGAPPSTSFRVHVAAVIRSTALIHVACCQKLFFV